MLPLSTPIYRKIIAYVLLIVGFLVIGCYFLWRNGYLGLLPVSQLTDASSWQYYNQYLGRDLLYPQNPWFEYLNSGAHKVVYLWIANPSESRQEVGVDVSSIGNIYHSSLIAQLYAKNSLHTNGTASCIAFSLRPRTIAKIPLLLTLTRTPGVYLHAYTIQSREGEGVACNPITDLLNGSGVQIQQQILHLSGGALTQE